jgi:hypothetical protein
MRRRVINEARTVYVRAHIRSGVFVRAYFRSPPSY